MKKISALICLLFVLFEMKAQKYLNRRNIQFGTALTALYESGDRNFYGKTYQEYYLAFNIATSVSPRIQVGVENMIIWHIVQDKPDFLQSNLFGVFGRYSVYSDKKTNAFFQLGGYYGNFCSCYPNSYQKRGLTYLDFGLGGNIRLSKNLFLSGDFNVYQLMQRNKEFYGLNKYSLGLNYIINFKNTIRSNG